MSSPVTTSYEAIPYDDKAFTGTHPDALAVSARLRGMNPPPVEQCRVLELGCANGRNLMSIAYSLPDSQCLGIDLSPRQIAHAQRMRDAVDLRNVEFRAMSILDVDETLGSFDYILCHGVFSWVPRLIQDKILEICSRHLTPKGVAYISYNTYPGWHLRGMVREMLCYHVQPHQEPEPRVQHARAFLNLLAKIYAHRSPDDTYGRILREEAADLEDAQDSYFFHEHLEDVNEPLYFHEFAERAAAQGLQYLWETKSSTFANSLPPEERGVLERLSEDLIRQEQYFDFLTNRVFRRTLLCHASVPLLRRPTAEAVNGCLVTSRAKPVSEELNFDSQQAEEFRTPEGESLTTNRPIWKGLLSELYARWPGSMSVSEMWESWQTQAARLPAHIVEREPIQTPQDLAGELLPLFLSQFVELHHFVPRCTTTISDRPQASRLARHQALQGRRVTNLRHFEVVLDDFPRLMLLWLDGSRDFQQLSTLVSECIARGEIQLPASPDSTAEPSVDRDWLNGIVSAALSRLAANALLIA